MLKKSWDKGMIPHGTFVLETNYNIAISTDTNEKKRVETIRNNAVSGGDGPEIQRTPLLILSLEPLKIKPIDARSINDKLPIIR